MGWEPGETSITFFCDMPSCERETAFNVHESRVTANAPPSHSDFTVVWGCAQAIGWRSFKRLNQPWMYFCPHCAKDAETAHREYNRQEQERERIKARNAY